MVSGYVRCGMLREARHLFDDPRAKKNVVTWTAMMSGYIRSKKIQEAANLFNKMPDKNVVSWNTMITGLIESGQLEKAYELFIRMPERNTVSWNTMMTGFSQNGKINEALDLFERIPTKDIISWTAMLTGLAQNGRIDEARSLFDEMPERNTVSWNAMVSGYAQNLRLDEARQLFEVMPEKDLPSWNAMISGYIQNNELQKAQELFNKMPERNVVTWTSLITGYIQEGLGEEALKLFTNMQHQRVTPNHATFVSLLAAVSDLAELAQGKQLHQIISKTVFQFSPFVVSALIAMYSKCGDIVTARKVFHLTEEKDRVIWNGIIAAHAYHGYGREAISLFESMRKTEFLPDGASFVGILSACSHSGLVEEGFKLFGELIRNEAIQLREDHCACLVDLCGRAGRLEDAAKFLDGIDVGRSSAIAWGALLAGCNVFGNVEVGKAAAKRLMEIEPGNAGTYMLMSNLYASAGRWKESTRMKVKMKDEGLKKQPGCSWVEIEGRIHVFVARDKSHCKKKEIYSLIKELHRRMKMSGYVPDNDSVAD